MVFNMNFEEWRKLLIELSRASRKTDDSYDISTEESWNDFMVLLFWGEGMLRSYWNHNAELREKYYETLILTVNDLPDYGAIESTFNFIKEGGLNSVKAFFKNFSFLYDNARQNLIYILSDFINSKKNIIKGINSLSDEDKKKFKEILINNFGEYSEYLEYCK